MIIKIFIYFISCYLLLFMSVFLLTNTFKRINKNKTKIKLKTNKIVNKKWHEGLKIWEIQD